MDVEEFTGTYTGTHTERVSKYLLSFKSFTAFELGKCYITTKKIKLMRADLKKKCG